MHAGRYILVCLSHSQKQKTDSVVIQFGQNRQAHEMEYYSRLYYYWQYHYAKLGTETAMLRPTQRRLSL